MRLAEFTLKDLESILQEWEDFAKSIQPSHRSMNVVKLRDRAEELLREIAADLHRPAVRARKSRGPRGKCLPGQ